MSLKHSLIAPILIVTLAACSDSGTSSDMNDADPNMDTDAGMESTGMEAPDEMQNTNDTNDTNDSNEGTDTGQTNNEPAETEAKYRITFDADWTPQSHALNYPTNPHFSGLVGSVHNEQVVFWERGQIATDGIERMAETGSKSIFLDEINAAIEAGSALSAIDGGGVGSGDGEATVEVTVTRDYPQITITTMIAPSPDWFAGLHNVDLFDGTAFVANMTFDAVLYDAGTDSGPQYQSSNDDTDPRDPILLLSSAAADAPFIEGRPAVGTFLIERID